MAMSRSIAQPIATNNKDEISAKKNTKSRDGGEEVSDLRTTLVVFAIRHNSRLASFCVHSVTRNYTSPAAAAAAAAAATATVLLLLRLLAHPAGVIHSSRRRYINSADRTLSQLPHCCVSTQRY